MSQRMQGTVAWYNDEKGFGFARPDDGGTDVFLHHSAIHGTGLRILTPGETVEFTRVSARRGPVAEDISRIARDSDAASRDFGQFEPGTRSAAHTA